MTPEEAQMATVLLSDIRSIPDWKLDHGFHWDKKAFIFADGLARLYSVDDNKIRGRSIVICPDCGNQMAAYTPEFVAKHRAGGPHIKKTRSVIPMPMVLPPDVLAAIDLLKETIWEALGGHR